MIAKMLKSNKGMTMFEVLIAAFVLIIVALPLLNLFANNASLVRVAYQRTDKTYDSKALMENMYNKGYAVLFKSGKATTTLDTASGLYYQLALSPAGPNNATSSTACYFHLILNNSGNGTFVGPDGKIPSGDLLTISSGLDNLTLDLRTAGKYSLIRGTTELISGEFPLGTSPVLLILAKSDSTTVNVTIKGTCNVLAYCKPTMDTSKLSAPDATSFSLYNNDAPPTTLLVNAVLKIRNQNDTATESVFQNTLSVGSLP